MTDPLNLPEILGTLAAIVRLHEGNHDAKITALLAQAEVAGEAFTSLLLAARAVTEAAPLSAQEIHAMAELIRATELFTVPA